ncbi:hypothetical protein [Paragemmobacter straminiformis]|uniref:Uncharacterized protein n=1 Tax=Paragemmobacter straminiformis TaxID=2045119 RepID=A0A842I613_9RHOB|nr:hypothetical protein [Gemmobacter straminiformis]MBC2835512.1 hypothetical protein [Gemmobacter straminiformis]
MTLQLVSMNREIALRLSGPGGLYNLGNGLGLMGGLALHISAAMAVQGAGLTNGAFAILDYLAGSLGATAITLAMLVFFWSGERYHRAWSKGAPPDARLNRTGDLSSGYGALLLGLGLLLLGQPVLAATSGLMHAAGKFGSALPPQVQARLPFGPRAFRLIVVASRGPALVAVLLQAQAALATGGGQALAASALLVLCYMLWLRADLALLRA